MKNAFKSIFLLILFITMSSCSDDDISEDVLIKKVQSGDIMAKVRLGTLYADRYRNSWVADSKLSADERHELYVDGQALLSQSAQFIKERAEQGDEKFINLLAFMYEDGWGVEKSQDNSIKWTLKLAEKGDYRSQLLVGIYYYGLFNNSKSTPPYWTESQKKAQDSAGAEHARNAIKWINKGLKQDPSTENEQALTRYMLGTIYFDLKQYHNAAAEFNKCVGYTSFCAHYLGELYLKGLGVRQDNKIAKDFYGKSCDSGRQEACEKYAELNIEGNSL